MQPKDDATKRQCIVKSRALQLGQVAHPLGSRDAGDPVDRNLAYLDLDRELFFFPDEVDFRDVFLDAFDFKAGLPEDSFLEEDSPTFNVPATYLL